ncbi:Uncharacterized protein DAT39_016013 [Clarias magur]|uniref:Uncharacterized protein n=1 Tax=Clarias magur TaxID=1594786 RepID=A0A8J4UAL6_CLAMG|nr:Uncharacterized protein DAT39_016013 [Clarias magur]
MIGMWAATTLREMLEVLKCEIATLTLRQERTGSSAMACLVLSHTHTESCSVVLQCVLFIIRKITETSTGFMPFKLLSGLLWGCA